MIIHYNEKLDAKIRVFISSTFRDMREERNIIVRGVFPLLRRKYKHQCIDITEVDLRWGITEKDIDNMTLLEICIGETLNCVPFFIGLIGDNYGTLAKLDEMKKLPPSYKRAIGMKNRDDFPEGLSLTELEMRAGVFTKENRDYARFFIRKTDAHIPEELERLKATVMNEGYSFSVYGSPEEFEKMVYDSLDELIRNAIPETPPAPYRDVHYISHLRLLKKGNSTYIPNDLFVEKVERAISTSRCVYLYGEKGMGKTSAMSYIIAREGLDRDGDVFFHFADADEESITQDNLYNRLRRYFESITGKRSNDSSDYNAIIELLKSTKFDRRVTLFFDAIEKYKDTAILAKLFTFNKINPEVYVVCSGAREYKSIPVEPVTIAPLDNEQIRQMTVRALRNFGKKLDEEHIEKIFNNAACRNPLYLSALLNQLISYDNHEKFEEFFESLICDTTFDDIFRITIERLLEHFREKGFDTEKIYLALALIAYSNMGVRESELGEIIGMLPIERSIFLASLEIFIVENDSLIRFNHDLIHRAAKRILEDAGCDYESRARMLLIEYFEREDERVGVRAFSEAPHQYEHLGIQDKLYERVSDISCFTYLAKNQFNNLIKYLMAVIDKTDGLIKTLVPSISDGDAPLASNVFCQSGHYFAAIEVIRRSVGVADGISAYDSCAPDIISDAIVASECKPLDKVRLFSVLARSYYKLALSRYLPAERSYQRAIDFYRSVYPDDAIGLATQSYLLGVTYKSMGRNERAEELLRLAADTFDKFDIKNDISSWIYAVYGNIRFALGDIKSARANLRRSIDDNAFLFGEDSSEIAWSYSYSWAIYYASGEKNTALNQARDAYRIYSALYDDRGAKVAWAASNYGSAYHITEKLRDARKYYELSIRENDAPVPESERPHVYSLTTYANLALLELECGNTSEAVRLIELARVNSECKNGAEHIYTANMLLNEGIIKQDPEIVHRAVKIFSGYATPDSFFARNCYARVLLLAGNDELAEQEIDSLYADYANSNLQNDLITYLINDSYGKISFSADEAEVKRIKEELTRFSGYKHYITFNNNSALVIIPEI